MIFITMQKKQKVSFTIIKKLLNIYGQIYLMKLFYFQSFRTLKMMMKMVH